MVSQVGLNTGYNYTANTNPVLSNTIGTNNSIFNMPQIANDYSDDIMMQKFDTMLNSAQNTQTQFQTQNPNQNLPADYNQTTMQNTNTSFTSNQPVQNQVMADTQQPINTNELNGYLVQQDKNIAYTENNNAYYKSTSAKKAGAVLGFLAPTAGKVVQLFKGGKFKDLFKFKQLAIACPALALVGFTIGSLVDGYINSNKAKAADIAAQENQQPQIMQPYAA